MSVHNGMVEAWSEPRCLVTFDVDGKLVANEDTLQALSGIKDPLVVVSVVGPYRSGKSYIMNRLAGTQKGFSVGSTVQGHTKGIWIWCRPHPTRQNCCLVLVDSEGLVDCERTNKTDDTYIFALTLLLSSTLVYNCKHAVDKTALDALHFVTVATEHIKVKSKAGSASGQGDADDAEDDGGLGLQKYFPIFVVAVRDFALKLEWEEKPVTEDEYLECILKLKPGKGRQVAEYNLPRECIRDFFPTRKLFTFPCPVRDDDQLLRLEELPDSQLSDQFRSKRDKFLEYIFGASKPKKVDINEVNGRAFAALTRCYVEAIEKGPICVESAVDTMAKAENQNIEIEAVNLYQQEFHKLVQFPTDTVEELSRAHEHCQKLSTDYFNKHCICDYDHGYKKAFLDRLQREFGQLTSDNIAISDERCADLLNKLCSGRLGGNNYMKAGGYKEYQKDIEQIRIAYEREKRKGVMANSRWSDFMTGQSQVDRQILTADKSIAEAQKGAEQAKRDREEAERRANAAGEAQAKLEQAIGEQDRSFKQEMDKMRCQMQADKQQREEEFRKQTEARQAEHDRLLKEGLAEKANMQMEAINMMKQEQQRASQEAEKNRQMFEKVIADQMAQQRQEAAEMRNALKASVDQNSKLGDQIAQLRAQQSQPKSSGSWCSIQ